MAVRKLVARARKLTWILSWPVKMRNDCIEVIILD